jgi:hypothetical protein
MYDFGSVVDNDYHFHVRLRVYVLNIGSVNTLFGVFWNIHKEIQNEKYHLFDDCIYFIMRFFSA